jgi:uncharacterized protein YcfL
MVSLHSRPSAFLSQSLGLALFAVLLSGCGTTAANTVEVAQGGGQTINEVNGKLADMVVIQGAKLSYLGEIAEMVATLESQEDESVRIEWRTKWYDKDGIEVQSAKDGWTPDFIHARETKQIKDMAPEPGVVKARFLVRLTDDQELAPK